MNERQTVFETALESQTAPRQVQKHYVLEVTDDGSVLVADGDQGDEQLRCDVLHTGEIPLRLGRGDTVLVWRPAENGRGVILGRVGKSHGAQQQAETPEEIVIEARERLVLKCGDGSVVLRGDGKMLIKGKDLVSRAQRMNRVKGGGVAIN